MFTYRCAQVGRDIKLGDKRFGAKRRFRRAVRREARAHIAESRDS